MGKQESEFCDYWGKHRAKQKKVLTQWYTGLPIGILFAACIGINYTLGWDKRAIMVANAEFNPAILIVAFIIIGSFTAYFYKKYQWEQNEQRYQELMHANKNTKENAT